MAALLVSAHIARIHSKPERPATAIEPPHAMHSMRLFQQGDTRCSTQASMSQSLGHSSRWCSNTWNASCYCHLGGT